MWDKSDFLKVIKAVEKGSSRKEIANTITGGNVQTAREMIKAVENRAVICNTGASIAGEIKAQQTAHAAKTELKQAKKELERMQRQLQIDSDIAHESLIIPKWVQPEKTTSSKSIMCSILSDTHFDEIVNTDEVNGCNEYNRIIATQRLQKYFENIILLDRSYIAGVAIEGFMLAMAGDMVAGNIHEELTITNAAPIIDTVLYWCGQIVAGVRLLLDHFKKVWVNCVVGNHGRTTPRLRFKGAVTENWDYLLYRMIAKEFDKVSGVVFHISQSTQTVFPVYNTVYGLHHGMDFRGGHGDAGAVVPMIRGNRRKREFQAGIGQPYDVLLMGHFHQLMRLPGVIANGSMVGYNEYAIRGSFPFERPQQACWLTDPIRGAQQPFFPIFCE